MLSRLAASALFAGLGAGAFATLLQLWFAVPLLMEGELYETGARTHFTATGGQSDAGVPDIWEEPARHLGSFGTNLIAWTGFALLLIAGFVLARRWGHEVTARLGLVWGLAGFLAVHLAPAIGLPPELPGTIGAELGARQAWWTLAVGASALGLGLLAFGPGPAWIALGALSLLLPHVIGAPHTGAYFGVAPPELAAHFATASLGVAAASWALLGALAGALWSRGG